MSCVVRWVVGVVAALGLVSCRPELALEISSDGIPPRVDPGIGGEFIVGSEVTLDGRASFDPDGEVRRHAWGVRSRPTSSQATIADPLAPSTTFALDVAGTYEIELTVTDDDGLTAVGRVVLRSLAPAISVDAGEDVTVPWRTTAQLTGSVGAEPGFPVTPSWTIVSRPPGSTAQLSDASSLTPSLYADRQGTYTIRLTAQTPHGMKQDHVSVFVEVPSHALAYTPVDAEYAKTRDRFVIVSAAPATLRVHDPTTGTETTVALSATPHAVAVSPSGHRAAVAHSGKVTIVDLDTMSVLRAVDVTIDAREILYGADDRVYAITRFGFGVGDLHIVDANTGAVTNTDATPNGRARLHPSGNAIYSAQSGGSPADFDRWEITPTTVVYSRNGPYHGDYDHGYDLWLTEDGAAVIGSSGNVFHISTNPALDMTYRATLANRVGGLHAAAHSTSAGEIAVLDAEWDPWFDNVLACTLRRYDDDQLTYVDGIVLPETRVGATSYPSDCRYVAWRADGSALYVISRAAAASGDVYTVLPITP